PSAAVNMGFGPDAAQQVGREVAEHQRHEEGRGNRPLAHQINRIDDLRIAEPGSADASGLDAEVDAADDVHADDLAALAQLAGEVDILLPSVKHETFVESQTADGARA